MQMCFGHNCILDLVDAEVFAAVRAKMITKGEEIRLLDEVLCSLTSS